MIRIHRKTFLLAAALFSAAVAPARGERMSLIGSGAPKEFALTVVYSVETGGVSVFAPEGLPLTAIQLTSSSGQFKAQCGSLDGLFDLCLPQQVFKLVPSGFAEADFGPILEPNLSQETLLRDLLVDGATVGGGFYVGDGPLLVRSGLVPEPSSGMLFLFGLSVMLTARNRRMLDRSLRG